MEAPATGMNPLLKTVAVDEPTAAAQLAIVETALAAAGDDEHAERRRLSPPR
jgi:hypothetical protein